MNQTARLTGAQETSLAIVAAVVTANAYYIHPIIALVADHFALLDDPATATALGEALVWIEEADA